MIGGYVMSNKLIKVGEYNTEFNDILGIKLDRLDIYKSKGLIAHLIKRKHDKYIKYIDCIPDIIQSPDYIGINPNENNTDSIELIKRYDNNVMIGIKLDGDNKYFYVASMYDVSESKIQRRLHSGRIKKYVDIDENK